MRWTLPNILTVLRLVAAPLMAAGFLVFGRPYADMFALVLFVLAATTDWLDGYLARAWNQTSRMGAMLDPIADKAMVVIALGVLLAISSLSFLILLPAALILFREVFVSGLREYLGDTAGTLAVTKLAKWKTTVQMVAISVLFAHGLAEHYFGRGIEGMGDLWQDVLAGEIEDETGIGALWNVMQATFWVGLSLLWAAALLTVVTGADYLAKAMPYLKEPTA
ncbi:MAG: CDP-diacylglycerol--glycerol-3-phosphate 3-phosphatidyltransferase [Pseudomonadota bacterium]